VIDTKQRGLDWTGADHVDSHDRGGKFQSEAPRRAEQAGLDHSVGWCDPSARASSGSQCADRSWSEIAPRGDSALRPKKPQDLTAHNCINIRLPTYGGLYAWEFEKRGRELKVHVEGQLVFNNLALRLNAALAGLGLAYLPEDQVQAHLASGELIRVLADWCPPFLGLPPLLSEPPATDTGVRIAGRGAPLPALTGRVANLRPRTAERNRVRPDKGSNFSRSCISHANYFDARLSTARRGCRRSREKIQIHVW
jgi:DNA-binding transcriptional LysR family regulator